MNSDSFMQEASASTEEEEDDEDFQAAGTSGVYKMRAGLRLRP